MINLSMSEIEELNEEEYCSFLAYGDPICKEHDQLVEECLFGNK